MNDQKTLLNLVGYTPPIALFSTTELIIIDAQNDYVQGPIQLPDVVTATARAYALLNAVRRA